MPALVAPNSPAARAGIEKGDRIVTFEGRPVPNSLYWGVSLAEVEIGRPLHLGIERRGEMREVVLTMGRRSGGPAGPDDWVRLARALLTFPEGANARFVFDPKNAGTIYAPGITRDLGLEETDGNMLGLEVGLACDLDLGSRLRFSFGEDLLSESAPDFSIFLAWSLDF